MLVVSSLPDGNAAEAGVLWVSRLGNQGRAEAPLGKQGMQRIGFNPAHLLEVTSCLPSVATE